MRLPIVPSIETRDGTAEKDGLCKNILMDQDEQGDFAAIRPGLIELADITGVGKGLVSYNDQLISVYESKLVAWRIPTLCVDGIAPWSIYSVTTAIAYKNGIWCVLGDSATKSFITSNGVTWQTGTITSSDGWLDVVSNSNIFVGLSYANGVKIIWSSDGLSWSNVTVSASGDSKSIASNGSQFLILVPSTGNTYTSSDGATWVTHTMGGTYPSGSGTFLLEWSGTYWVCVRSNSNSCYYSSDGITWNNVALPISRNWTGLATKDGLTIVLAPEGDIVRSFDLLTWDNGIIPSGVWDGFTELTASTSYFVCCPNPYGTADGWNVAYKSRDGYSWEEVTLSAEGYLKDGLAAGGDQILIVDEESKAFFLDLRQIVSSEAATITGSFFDFAQSPL